LTDVNYKGLGVYYVNMSQAVRNRQNRKNNSVRNKQIVGNGVSVYATRYATGHSDVDVEQLSPSTPREAALLFN